jgi:hypothetical protein
VNNPSSIEQKAISSRETDIQKRMPSRFKMVIADNMQILYKQQRLNPRISTSIIELFQNYHTFAFVSRHTIKHISNFTQLLDNILEWPERVHFRENAIFS